MRGGLEVLRNVLRRNGRASLKSHPPACGLLPGRLLSGRLLRPATRQRCAGIALRSRLARVPILWSVRLDLFPSFDDPTKSVPRDWHTTIIGFSLACLEHRSSSHLVFCLHFHADFPANAAPEAGRSLR